MEMTIRNEAEGRMHRVGIIPFDTKGDQTARPVDIAERPEKIG
jgi:hypothetical protein